MTKATIGRQLRAGFAASLVATLFLAAVAIIAIDRTSDAMDRLIGRDARLVIDAHVLEATLADRATYVRGYLLTGDAAQLERVEEAAGRFQDILATLRQEVHTRAGHELLQRIGSLEADYADVAEQLIVQRGDGDSPSLQRAIDAELFPALERTRAVVDDFVEREEALIVAARGAADRQVAIARWLFVGLAIAAVLSAVVIGWWISSRVSRQLRALAGEVDASAEEVASGTGRLTSGAAQQSAAIQETVATVTELAASAEETARRARSVADRAEEFADAAERGNTAVGEAVEGARALQEQVDAIAERILGLASHARSISEIVAAVDDITEQTNLLALNAAIEAARAGEHGKGFGVVASEIRRLADQTRNANAQISGILGEIQQATNQAVLTTEEGTKAAATGMDLVAEAGQAITELSGAVAASADAAEQIAAASGQQAGATAQIRDAMTEIEEVTQHNLGAARQAEETAQQLSRIADDLKAIVGASA